MSTYTKNYQNSVELLSYFSSENNMRGRKELQKMHQTGSYQQPQPDCWDVVQVPYTTTAERKPLLSSCAYCLKEVQEGMYVFICCCSALS